MKNAPGVYILEFPSGIYVGSSKHMRRRVLRHIADMKRGTHSNSFLQRVFDKHGEPSCRVERECDESELLIHEQDAIDRLKPRLNLSPTAGRNVGHKHSTETIEAMRLAAKRGWSKRDRTVGDTQRKLISASLKGRQFSDETRRKISAAKTGERRSEEACKRLSEAKKGKSIKQVGHVMTPEIKAKISAGLRARSQTEAPRLPRAPIILYAGRDA
jgi:group I intron endonuclease